MKKAKDDAALIQAAIDADLKMATEDINKRIEIIWGWEHNDTFDLATVSELNRLTAASEEAEYAVYEYEVILRVYQEYKRKQCKLSADDWRDIVDRVKRARHDVSGHEATPDWKWFVDSVLARAQCQCDEGLKAALRVRNAIAKRIGKDEIDKAALGKLSSITAQLNAIQADTSATAANVDAARQDIANVGDTMCEIVGKERIPPKPKEVAASSRRELYTLAKRVTKKRGNLETFLDKSQWRFRGFTAREIYKDADGLRKFIHAEEMAISREAPPED